jgi:hypothetical protein
LPDILSDNRMSERAYIPRLCDQELHLALQSSGAVLIEGPKWCGKTRTASTVANSVLFLQDPDQTAAYLAMADAKPSLLLKGETPRLIDEWQMAPILWDAVRFDHREYCFCALPWGVAGQYSAK